MSDTFGLEPYKDDDELLDRLSTRTATVDDGLEGLLASWTASIDEDYREHARSVGPLGLELPESESHAASRPRVIAVPRSRAVAALGAVVLTLSGGGVAAAMTGGTIAAPVKTLMTKVAEAAGIQPPLTPEVSVAAASASPTTSPGLPALLEQARQEAARNPVKAMGMLDVIRSLAPKDPAGNQLTAEADRLASQITATDPALATAAAPATQTPPGEVMSQVPPATAAAVADAPAPKTDSPVETKPSAPVTVTTPTTGSTGSVDGGVTAGTQEPSKPTSTGKGDASEPAATKPEQPAPPLGQAGGEQKAGTSTGDTAERPEHTSPTDPGSKDAGPEDDDVDADTGGTVRPSARGVQSGPAAAVVDSTVGSAQG